MVLRENSDELNLSFNFKVDGFSYMVFATSETMKCFGCGAQGHLIRSCPEGAGGRRAAAAAGEGFAWPRRPEGGRLLQDRRAVTPLRARVGRCRQHKVGVELTPQELYAALMSLKSGKAPGIDGLPVDFYKSFWSVLGEDLLEVFNNCLERGLLPLSCRRAVITLLPKKGDLQELKNWRPVSLLCMDYKITVQSPGLQTQRGSVSRLFLGQVALGPSEHPVSAKGGGWTGSGPSSQQGRCLSAFSSYRDSSPDLQTWFGGVYPAASLQRCGGLRLVSGSVPDGLQESGHFISASFLQKCFLSVDFTEEAEEGTGRLSVLALTGTGTVWRVSGLSQLEWTHFVQTTESCRCFHSGAGGGAGGTQIG
ncbi:hypothetical protein L3Q82_012167 [Scortum barcoo]|uniref:Uncharacterized protein n=1 Tax=Scortum barcoo TaxID=214431 RepID=A0ACB8W700_9TELE|nr:hypothetical protein L3Q82_012167 [Scortum barcoo]